MRQLEATCARFRGQHHSFDDLINDLDDLEEWLAEAEAILAIRSDLLLNPLPQLEVAVKRHKVQLKFPKESSLLDLNYLKT